MSRLAFFNCLLLALNLPLAAAASPFLTVDIKIKGKADYKGASTKTQIRTLNVEIGNYNKDAVPDVKVKWWIFGHNMKEHKLIVIKEGESKVVVPAKSDSVFTSPEVKVTGTREHKVSSRKRGRGGRRGRISTKTIPASGQEYYGYAVEVYSGNIQIAADYTKPSIKEYLYPKGD